MHKEIEVMQVLRTPPMGKLVVSVNKQRYERITDIREEHVRHLLMAAIGELIDFAGGYNRLVDAGVAPALLPDSSQQAGTAPLNKKQEDFLARLKAERDAEKAAQSPKPKFPVMSGLQPSLRRNQTGTISIVDQIDAILQKHIDAEPKLADRSIHLVKAPSSGLQIEVDGVRYQRPSEINDKLIQLMIKRALKEWESV